MKRISRVQREIKQSRPFPSPCAEAAVALLLTADKVRRNVAKVVEPHGITIQQYNVLRILRGAGQAGIATLEIVERMIEQTPGITRLLDRLEAKQLVRRQRCPSDRRQVLCWITETGTDLLSSLDKSVQRADAEVMQSLGKKEVVELIELLDRVRSGTDELTP